MAQKHNSYVEKPMTRYGTVQSPSRRYRRLRHPTFEASVWADKNPLLQRGEIGYEVDTRRIKIGDGVTYWNDLSYSSEGASWGNIVGDIDDQTDLKDALDLKANTADLGTAAYTDSSDYATSAQGALADSALQPGDNVSELVNDAGYLTQHQTLADLGITATAAEINVLDGITASTTELNYTDGVTSNIQTQIDNKQPKSASAYNMGNSTGGWTAMSTAQQNAINSGATTTNIGQIATNTSNIADEIINRQDADNGLQSQIDAIVAKSDVVDIVGTYAELQAYDTSSLGNNDVVKVLDDSTHNDAQSYYRWVISGGVGSWVYIGSEAETYTKAETDALLNGKQDTLTAGTNIQITGTTISATDTTYTGSDGVTLTGTNFTNSGVRSVSSGTTNGTISVNTNGTSADVAITGLGSAAYTNSSAYATAAQGTLASTAVQPGDLATVATSGLYSDLTGTPTIPTTLAALTGDVDITTPTDGQHLVYDANDQKWKNTSSAATVSWGGITGTLSDQTDLDNALKALVPAGTVMPWAGISVPPAGYLYCDGSAVSRTTYADLFAAIGTTYGPGDGSTTFNLPNYTSWYMLSSDITIAGNGNFTLKANGTNRRIQWLDAKITSVTPNINQGVLGLSGAIPNSKNLYETQFSSGLQCNKTAHTFNFCIKY